MRQNANLIWNSMNDWMLKFFQYKDSYSSFWFPFLVSIYDRRMEILRKKHVRCPERVSLYASVSLQSLIFKVLIIILEWFSSYLKGRSQVTQIGEHVSTKELNPCGVPQGSVLGPLLFLIYINDIHKSSDKLNFFLFADDTTLLFGHKNLKVLEQVVNSELSKVSEWLVVNKLSLNIKKSNYVIFCPSQKKFNKEISIKMYDNSANGFCSLEHKDFVKFLGIVIDCNLK